MMLSWPTASVAAEWPKRATISIAGTFPSHVIGPNTKAPPPGDPSTTSLDATIELRDDLVVYGASDGRFETALDNSTAKSMAPARCNDKLTGTVRSTRIRSQIAGGVLYVFRNDETKFPAGGPCGGTDNFDETLGFKLENGACSFGYTGVHKRNGVAVSWVTIVNQRCEIRLPGQAPAVAQTPAPAAITAAAPSPAPAPDSNQPPPAAADLPNTTVSAQQNTVARGPCAWWAGELAKSGNRPSDQSIEACNAADDACAYLAASAPIGQEDVGRLSPLIERCNAHPRNDICRSTVEYMGRTKGGLVPPSLTCNSNEPPSDAAGPPTPTVSAEPKTIARGPCAWWAGELTKSGNRPSDKLIEACNAADDACAYLAASAPIGQEDVGRLSPWIEQCNAHPRNDICRSTVEYMGRTKGGLVPPSLTCNSNEPQDNK